MDNFFSTDNILFKILGRIVDIFLLNLFWLICSIPVFTIGASTTALYYTAMKAVKLEEGYIAKRFFKSFKENFKQSTLLWLICLFAGAVFGFDMFFSISNRDQIYGKPFMFIFTITLCLYLFTMTYVFPLQAKFKNSIKGTLKNAFLLSIKNFPWTLLILLLVALIGFLLYASPIFGVFMILMGMGCFAYLTSFIYNHIFKPFLPEERPVTDEEFHVNDEETDITDKTEEAAPKKLSMADKANSVSRLNN